MLLPLLVLGVILLAGCPPAKDGDQADGDEPALQQGGTISLPLSLAADDPALAALDFSDPRLFALARCIGVPLVRSDAAGALSPGLAESWDSADFITWKLKLAPLPAAGTDPDYAAKLFETKVRSLLAGEEDSLRGQLEDLVAGAAAYAKGTATDISGITYANGELTIALTRPFAQLPLWLSQPGLHLVPGNPLQPAADAAAAQPSFAPFSVASTDGGVIALAANAEALHGAPRLAAIRFVLEPDPQRQTELFVEGKLDAANLPTGEAAELDAESARVEQLQTAAIILGCFDLHEFPWGDSQFQQKLGLRQALNLALNVDTIAEENGGAIQPWRHFFPEAMHNNVPASLVRQPTFGAQEQLEEAGMALRRADHWQGNHLIPGMDLTYLETQRIDGIAVSVLEFWNDISVNMRPHQTTLEDLRVRVGLGTHEIILYKFCPAYADANALAYPLLYSKLRGLKGNWLMLDDPQVDALIVDAQATDDALLREKKFQELSAYLEENALLVFIGYASPSIALSSRLGGLSIGPYDFDASLPGQDFSKLGVSSD